MIKVGNVTIPTNIISAPLAGCSDLPYRLIARELGAKFCFFEMCDANSVVRTKRTTTDVIQTCPEDTPVAPQLLGADPMMMVDAAKKLIAMTKAPFLDINCACPVKKVIRKKAGAYLLRDKKTLSVLLTKLVCSLSIPVTVKLRIGYDRIDIEDAAAIAKTCEDSGVKAIFVHGRTRDAGYTGEIHYPSIKAMKDSVSIPVIGSGNILSPQLAKRMFDETGCDGVLVARGGLGNPWLFKEIEDYVKHGIIHKECRLPERCKILKRHLYYIAEYKEIHPTSRVGLMRKTALWYIRSFPHAARVRERIGRAKKLEAILEIVDELPHLLYQNK